MLVMAGPGLPILAPMEQQARNLKESDLTKQELILCLEST